MQVKQKSSHLYVTKLVVFKPGMVNPHHKPTKYEFNTKNV